MPPQAEIVERIMVLADRVEGRPDTFGVLSAGERIAVAFVLDRPDLLKRDGWTMLKALDRLGPEWTAAASAVASNVASFFTWAHPTRKAPTTNMSGVFISHLRE